MTNSSELTPARKAAILISTLDVESADRLLEQLPAELAQQVREMALALDEVSPAQRDAVVQEFFAAGGRTADDTTQTTTAAESGGVELHLSSHEGTQGATGEEQQGDATGNGSPNAVPASNAQDKSAAHASEPQDAQPRFEILHRADTSSLSGLLRDEHPQIVAVIVAHLPRDRAARLLAEFPLTQREEIARRIQHLEEMHPDILRELEQGLATRFADLGLDSNGSAQGHVILQEILAAAEPQVREQLQTSLNVPSESQKPSVKKPDGGHSPQRVQTASLQIPQQKLPMTFVDVQRLSGDALFQVFTTVAPEEAILALFDAPESFVARVLDQLSPRESRVWRYALAHPGPTRLSDVIAAQARIAFAAEELAATGRIDLPFQHMALVA